MSSGIELLKKIRKERGLTQLTLAKLLKKHNQSISNIEMGKSIPHKSTINKLCIVLALDTGTANGLKEAFNAARAEKRGNK